MYKNIVLQSCADKVELFCRLRDFICSRNGTYDYSLTGIGWTLHDSSYAVNEDSPQSADWFVMYSPGESGNDDLYMHVLWGTNSITISGYLYWNNSTHAGVNRYNSTANYTVSDSGASYELSVYGDLDFIASFETLADASYDYCVYFGKLSGSVYDDTVANCSSVLSSGTDVSIDLDAVPSTWSAGDRLFIKDNNRIDIITIKTISGNTITADLVNGYDANSKVQADIGYVVNNSGTSTTCYSITGHSTTVSLYCSAYTDGFISSVDPDLLNSEMGTSFMSIVGAGSFLGRIPNLLSISTTGFTQGSVYAGNDGNSYRCFKYYSSVWLLVKEV